MDNIIEVKELSKIYKDGREKIYALDKVSFNLPRGESLAIVGPSGSGKTTLLQLMGGLDKPTSGTVVINGKRIDKGSDREISKFRNKTIGFVFQMMYLQDYFTAIENVMIPQLIAHKKRKDARQKAEELLIRVGLKERMHHQPNKLSGGELQRVAIARALANDPQIVMADEPTGKLDEKNALKVLEIFQDISKTGVSVVIITHDNSLAKHFDNLIRIEHGKIKELAENENSKY